MGKYSELCNKILDNVGGKDNILAVTNCVTRLRLTLKDQGLAKQEDIKKLKGVLGCQFSYGQLQIIIGQDVPDVCKEFCEISGITQGKPVDEDLNDVPQKKFSFKNLFNAVINTIAGCIIPLIPIFISAGILKMLVTILGPNLLNLLPAKSNLLTLFTFVGDAGFYFLPIFVAWSAAKKFNTSIPVSMFLGAVLISPTLIDMVKAGGYFTVYGIPITFVNYANQILPTILTVWILSYVYKFINKYIPNSLKYALVPICSILVMLPIMLCVLAPCGTYIGQGISDFSLWLSEKVGPLAVGLIGGLWYFLVGLGMDKALIPVVLNQFATYGYDGLFWLSAVCATYALIGVSVAYMIRCSKEDKSTAASNAITIILGGVSEPTIFGCIFRYKQAMISLFAGGFAGGFIASLLGAKTYAVGVGNILFFTVCAGGNGSNFVPAIIAAAVAFGVSLVLSLTLGFSNKSKIKTK